jgi:molybdate/tungstate transport system substrate-binding protein
MSAPTDETRPTAQRRTKPRDANARGARLLLAAFTLAAACSPSEQESASGPLVVFTAGSLGRPMRAALDSFERREGVRYELETAGSLETARKLTELGKRPDIVALADEEVFPKLLEPTYTTWYARFARNRLVIAYSPSSRFAGELASGTWWRVLTSPGVEVGRSDPDRDPSGYRALIAMQLAELHYGEPGLAARLEHAASRRNVRPKEADLVALLETGELDAGWLYESLARSTGLPFVALPPEIDLGTPAQAASYARASVRVLGAGMGDTLTIVGSPIAYAISIPTAAPHGDTARRFLRFLLSADGRAALRAQALDALDRAIVVGTGAPPIGAGVADSAAGMQ